MRKRTRYVAVGPWRLTTERAMTSKEFFGYALGTAFVLAVLAAALAIVVIVFSVIPLMVLLFPLTIAIVSGFILVGYLRHRRTRRVPPRS